MKTIDFCGNKLQSSDISSSAVIKPSTLLNFVLGTINLISVIAILFIFYSKYNSNYMGGSEAAAGIVFSFLGLVVVNAVIGALASDRTHIVEIKMISGGKHKSPKMHEYDAKTLNDELSEMINKN